MKRELVTYNLLNFRAVQIWRIEIAEESVKNCLLPEVFCIRMKLINRRSKSSRLELEMF